MAKGTCRDCGEWEPLAGGRCRACDLAYDRERSKRYYAAHRAERAAYYLTNRTDRLAAAAERWRANRPDWHAERSCIHCGTDFLPQHPRQLVCQRTCRRKSRRCAVCGEPYASSDASIRTCGRKCGSILRRPPRSELRWRQCHCGEWFVKRRNHCHCPPVAPAPKPPKVCIDCGAPPWAKSARYCERCKRRHAQCSRRRSKLHRRNIRQVDVFDTQDVAERDGWVCHLCEKPVDASLSANHQMAATIDHILPVSLGGIDSLGNVALAHRSCNASRGNTLIGIWAAA